MTTFWIIVAWAAVSAGVFVVARLIGFGVEWIDQREHDRLAR